MQDRVPTYPGRVTLTPVAGKANTYDMARADEPTQAGTPLNKATLLKDATAALFGMTILAVPDDVLAYLGKYNQYWWKRSSLNGYTISVGAVSRVTVGEGGMDGVSSIQYSSSVSVSSSGTITLDNPVSASINENVLNQLKGKYFSGYNLTGIYYATTSAGTSVTGGSPLYYNIDCGKVTAEKSGGTEVIYLQSSDREAYPDSGESGGYEYQFLGVPFDNAVEAPKIATGSYVGTGTYGASNPNSLTFDFEPKVVFIQGTSLSNYSGYFGGCFVKNASAGPVFMSTENNNNQGAYWAVMTEWDGKSFAYYSKVSNAYQMNLSGGTYTYLAIG